MLKLHSRKFSTTLCRFNSGNTSQPNAGLEFISSAKAPKAVGPYSQAVKFENTLYISGCLGLVPETGNMIDDTTVGQARQALTNMKNVLEAGGSSLQHVLKTTVLLADIEDFKAVNEIYSECLFFLYLFFTCLFYFVDFDGDFRPARSCYAVKALPKNAKVEIEAIAACKKE